MTVQWVEKGGADIGVMKSFTISSGAARETLLGSALTLPTTEPASGQFSYTIESDDLPTISPNVPMKYNAALYASGKIGAAASVLNFRILKNGSSVFTGPTASATATQIWTHTHWRTFDVVVGDVIELRYWAAQADVTLEWHGLILYPAQPLTSKAGTILKDLTFTNFINGNTFTAITPTVQASNNIYIQPTNSGILNIAMNGNVTWPSVSMSQTYGLFRSHVGDIFGASTVQNIHATQRQIAKNSYPQNITYHEVLR